MPPPASHLSSLQPRLRAAPAGPITFGVVLAASILLLASLGHENATEHAAATINSLVVLLNAGLLGVAYLFAAFGLGRPVARLFRMIPGLRDVEDRIGPLWIQAPLGVGATMWLSHLLGVLGLLSGPLGLWIGWGVVAIGLALLADQVIRGPLRPEKWAALPIGAALGAPALGAILLAACSPPGSLWLGASSEGGAYDVLSYHLQLPKEWVADGARLWPSEHNVYSFLPGYMESAFLHLAAMTRGGLDLGGSFVAGSGLGVIASQVLHASLGVLTALLVARLVRVVSSAGADPASRAPLLAAIVAGASVLGVPWVMVVGSLAYNELGVTAMLAAALMLSLERSWSSPARGAGVGFLVGIACSMKPTSLFMVAPVAGLFLLFSRRETVRDRLGAGLAGSVAGILALAPWLMRNWLASGNPVFPFAAGLFGLSHWSREQMDRYSHAHAFDGSVADRFALLFDGSRGILNEQWAIFFPIGIIALGAIVAMRRTRRLGALLALGVGLQLGAWLFLTHLQSRFLLPVLVPLGIALGIGVNELLRWVGVRTASHSFKSSPRVLARLAGVVVALVPLSLTAWSWLIYASQRAGRPNQLLAVGGVEFFTGHAFAAEFAQLQPAQRREALAGLHPAAFINFTLPPDRAVYFIGGATPLYFVPVGGPGCIVYHTTWDRNPLGDAIRAHPDDPKAWTAGVRADGRPGTRSVPAPRIDFVLVDFDELSRLYPEDGRRPVWFDPDVTPERLTRWLTRECEPVQVWRSGESSGSALFRLRDAATPEIPE